MPLDWNKIDPAPAPAARPTQRDAAAWDRFDPAPTQRATRTPTDQPQSLASQANDAGANFITGLLRVPGAIIGLPHFLGHTANWAEAQFRNGMDKLTGGPGGHTGAELDAQSPVMSVLPSAQDVDRFVESPPGVPEVLKRPIYQDGEFFPRGKEAQFYQPESVGGRLFQAAVTGAASGGTGGVGAVKTGLAAAAAQGSNELFPDSPALAAIAALATHGGASGLESVLRTGGGVVGDAVRQVARPTKAGQIEAGRVLTEADNSLPGLATPTRGDITDAERTVRGATDAIGPGLPDHMAGAEVRAGLQSRADALKAARSAATDAAFDAFREQPALPSTALEPFIRSPSFRKAMAEANGAVLDEGGEPLTKFFNLDDDVPTHLTGEAIPPDVLHRVQSHLNDAVNAAPAGSAVERTATMLRNRFRDFLDEQYKADGSFPGYAAIRRGYADASRPLDPMSHGPVEKVLDVEKQFGRSRPTFPDERIPDLFLRSNATRADLSQLVAAHGGDQRAAMSALQEHLAGVAQRAVRPDGTLDAAAFDKAMQPYQKSLGNMGVWFPELAGKFANAKSAQSALDTLHAQRGIADAVTNGALRDSDGVLTGPSFGRWLRSNSDALTATQSSGALMRLQSINHALQGARPGELADALKSEVLPGAIGMATGGLEGGVLGLIAHKLPGGLYGKADAARREAFSAAIERATIDPAYAQRLAFAAGHHRAKGWSPVRALVRAVAATPLAVNSASSSKGQ